MIQKEELISKIMEMADLSNDEKAEIIGSLRKAKKYGLVWEDHPEDAEQRLKSAFPVLREVKELAINSSPFKGDERGSSPNHILIEGDNLEALMALSYTHEGKVDVIYIDPPYNTGNKDFIYNDCIVDSEDGYRHSKWLSFMEKRLRLAKKLLSDKGVIFISIDDNEQANLKLLCDEVFGEINGLGPILWKKKTNGNNMGLIPPVHDYILAYANSIENLSLSNFGYPLTDEYISRTYSNPDNDPRGLWTTTDLSANHKGPYFPITNPLTGEVHYPSKGRYWVFNETEVERRIKEGLIIFGKSGNAKPVQRVFLKDRELKRIAVESWWDKHGLNADGTVELGEIFGEAKKFIHPKPTITIKKIIEVASANSNALILDFFAGSGTTLHATMQLNAEDGGHRQCILVTNNENNICRDVTYERNKRVIQGYTTPKGVAVEGLSANNLRYYTMDFLPREYTNEAKRELMRAATDMLCIKEGIYNEVREFCGMKFKPSILRYFKESDGRQMLLVFDERVIEHIVPMMATIEGKLKIYVFSNGAYAYEDEFQELRDKVELCALPEALLQVYKQVLPQNDEEVRI